MRRTARRWVLLALALCGAGVLAGGVIAARFNAFENPERLANAVDDDPLVLAADIPAADGAGRHSMFVQETSTGHLCIWDTPSADRRLKQGGCNPASDPLGGRPLSVSLAYDGGPSAATVRDARLIGLGAADVADVEVLMSDGTRRTMHLRTVRVGTDEYHAFGYRFKHADLRRGVRPTAVIAFGASGAEIDRQTTGFAG